MNAIETGIHVFRTRAAISLSMMSEGDRQEVLAAVKAALTKVVTEIYSKLEADVDYFSK